MKVIPFSLCPIFRSTPNETALLWNVYGQSAKIALLRNIYCPLDKL